MPWPGWLSALNLHFEVQSVMSHLGSGLKSSTLKIRLSSMKMDVTIESTL